MGYELTVDQVAILKVGVNGKIVLPNDSIPGFATYLQSIWARVNT